MSIPSKQWETKRKRLLPVSSSYFGNGFPKPFRNLFVWTICRRKWKVNVTFPYIMICEYVIHHEAFLIMKLSNKSVTTTRNSIVTIRSCKLRSHFRWTQFNNKYATVLLRNIVYINYTIPANRFLFFFLRFFCVFFSVIKK